MSTSAMWTNTMIVHTVYMAEVHEGRRKGEKRLVM